MTEPKTAAEIEQAMEVVRQIQKRVDNAISPLAREMQIMGWKPEYRSIVWDALARKALLLAAECNK